MNVQTAKKFIFNFIIDLGIIIAFFLLYSALSSTLMPIINSLGELSVLMSSESEVSLPVLQAFNKQIEGQIGKFYLFFFLLIGLFLSLPLLRWLEFKPLLKKPRKIRFFYFYSVIMLLLVLFFGFLITLFSAIPFLVLLLFAFSLISINVINTFKVFGLKSLKNPDKLITYSFLLCVIQIIAYFAIIILIMVSVAFFFVAFTLTNTIIRLLFVKWLENTVS
jgi:hypothetical protein